MSAVTNSYSVVNPYHLKKLLRVRKAQSSDINGIYDVASSVGTSEKISEQGFLIDDYLSKPFYYKKKIGHWIENLEYFYVAEYDKIYGFMMAYTKKEWLKENPNWIQDVYWNPEFDLSWLNNFIVVDKTAVFADLTGMGIGSLIYKRLLEDLKVEGIEHIFAETIISPQPNFASLQFRKKQKYSLAGFRYEKYNNILYTDLIYHKKAE
ncbi:MAG: GNAT family N-acetyltransferase [Gracilibacteraceae bacterium]|jgi:N-acetylglutamate synthase-like GNAT family acetyltransferase|nr:GNAT family N-acetyltransferase [Gracilibacteraceae bacterium]